ncbi:MAG: 2-C-methyl-D-erythritol 2,4-cyclodiphosphate synthase [Elusimicrobia bacterium]|nr:2-C-methyl-D-erythritol 2,4-cyclodiphosphate synthase [Elusimicrobiota bacterium]MBU2614522.1 2-C-methyl-D-erythritol 2,4-cyclodiphosphate synthase [Elusimicrobiota bacterium]
MSYRTGFGYDIHKLVKGRKLFIGGVQIPYKLGLLGHSDADVLLHSISDAILGAACLDDIGIHFPNTDKKYKDISSLLILKKSYELMKSRGYEVENIDCTIIAQEPKIMPYRKEMIKNISKILNTSSINIKATTSEGIGPIGKKEGIACYSVALLSKQ